MGHCVSSMSVELHSPTNRHAMTLTHAHHRRASSGSGSGSTSGGGSNAILVAAGQRVMSGKNNNSTSNGYVSSQTQVKSPKRPSSPDTSMLREVSMSRNGNGNVSGNAIHSRTVSSPSHSLMPMSPTSTLTSTPSPLSPRMPSMTSSSSTNNGNAAIVIHKRVRSADCGVSMQRGGSNTNNNSTSSTVQEIDRSNTTIAAGGVLSLSNDRDSVHATSPRMRRLDGDMTGPWHGAEMKHESTEDLKEQDVNMTMCKEDEKNHKNHHKLDQETKNIQSRRKEEPQVTSPKEDINLQHFNQEEVKMRVLKSSLFGHIGLSPSVMSTLVDSIRPMRLERHQHLWKVGDMAESMIIVANEEAEVCIEMEMPAASASMGSNDASYASSTSSSPTNVSPKASNNNTTTAAAAAASTQPQSQSHSNSTSTNSNNANNGRKHHHRRSQSNGASPLGSNSNSISNSTSLLGRWRGQLAPPVASSGYLAFRDREREREREKMKRQSMPLPSSSSSASFQRDGHMSTDEDGSPSRAPMPLSSIREYPAPALKLSPFIFPGLNGLKSMFDDSPSPSPSSDSPKLNGSPGPGKYEEAFSTIARNAVANGRRAGAGKLQLSSRRLQLLTDEETNGHEAAERERRDESPAAAAALSPACPLTTVTSTTASTSNPGGLSPLNRHAKLTSVSTSPASSPMQRRTPSSFSSSSWFSSPIDGTSKRLAKVSGMGACMGGEGLPNSWFAHSPKLQPQQQQQMKQDLQTTSTPTSSSSSPSAVLASAKRIYDARVRSAELFVYILPYAALVERIYPLMPNGSRRGSGNGLSHGMTFDQLLQLLNRQWLASRLAAFPLMRSLPSSCLHLLAVLFSLRLPTIQSSDVLYRVGDQLMHESCFFVLGGSSNGSSNSGTGGVMASAHIELSEMDEVDEPPIIECDSDEGECARGGVSTACTDAATMADQTVAAAATVRCAVLESCLPVAKQCQHHPTLPRLLPGGSCFGEEALLTAAALAATTLRNEESGNGGDDGEEEDEDGKSTSNPFTPAAFLRSARYRSSMMSKRRATARLIPSTPTTPDDGSTSDTQPLPMPMLFELSGQSFVRLLKLLAAHHDASSDLLASLNASRPTSVPTLSSVLANANANGNCSHDPPPLNLPTTARSPPPPTSRTLQYTDFDLLSHPLFQKCFYAFCQTIGTHELLECWRDAVNFRRGVNAAQLSAVEEASILARAYIHPSAKKRMSHLSPSVCEAILRGVASGSGDRMLFLHAELDTESLLINPSLARFKATASFVKILPFIKLDPLARQRNEETRRSLRNSAEGKMMQMAVTALKHDQITAAAQAQSANTTTSHAPSPTPRRTSIRLKPQSQSTR